jgi:hypothetical protein
LSSAQCADDDSDLAWSTKAEIFFKWSKGPLSAEIKLDELNESITGNLLKSYFAKYDFGAYNVTIGNTKCLTKADVIPGKVGGLGVGDYGGYGDAELLKVQVPLGMVTLSFAGLAGANSQATVTASPFAATANTDLDISQPALEMRADFQVGPVAGAVFGGMYSYEEVYTGVGTALGERSYDVDSSTIGFAAKAGFGPMIFSFNIFEETNNYGGGRPFSPFAWANPIFDVATATVIDYETFGWAAAIEYNITRALNITVRYGAVETEIDGASTNANHILEDKADSLGISVDYGLGPNMGVAFGYVNNDNDDILLYQGAGVTPLSVPQGESDSIRFEYWITF